LEIASARIPAPKSGRFDLYPIGDIHLGAAACDLGHFRRTVAQVAADPYARWIGMGDYGDFILPEDPRWKMSVLDWKRLGYRKGRPDLRNLAQEYRDMIRAELEPIKAKCIGLLDGNHDDYMKDKYHLDVVGELCDWTGAPYLGYTALIRVEVLVDGGGGKVRVWPFTIFAEHGSTGGGTDGNAVNSLQKRGAEFDADVYLKGHVHKRSTGPRKTVLAWGKKKIAVRDKVFVLTGTYLKGYSEYETTYGERKGYPPNEIGGTVVRVTVKPRSNTGELTGRISALDVEAA
jgi:hypothetical protein